MHIHVQHQLSYLNKAKMPIYVMHLSSAVIQPSATTLPSQRQSAELTLSQQKYVISKSTELNLSPFKDDNLFLV